MRNALAWTLALLGVLVVPSGRGDTAAVGQDPPGSVDSASGTAADAMPAPQRGHDPWVFRCAFEDRTGMVLIAPGEDLWFAFNPETCAMHRIWRGDVAFRGKVFDFSQENSVATGETLYVAPSTIWNLPDHAAALGGAWEAERVAWEQGWSFDGDGATLTSPVFDLSGWRSVFLAFDESSRKGPITVQLSNDAGKTWAGEFFDSTTHVSDDEAWQWNFKAIAERSEQSRVRFLQRRGAFGKKLRGIRMFGDRTAWFELGRNDETRPVKTHWRGYLLKNRTEQVVLRYDLQLSGRHRVSIEHVPEAPSEPGSRGWRETYTVEGLPEGRIVGLARLPDPGERSSASPHVMTFNADGTYEYNPTLDGAGGTLPRPVREEESPE